jgi:FKBP12-rapamycin complex-associated protein
LDLHVITRSFDELRKDALDAICALAVALGTDFAIFVPSVRKPMQRHHLQHSQFDAIEAQLRRREPVLLDLQTSPVAAASSVAFDGMLMPANSFHGLDPKMYDTDGSDPSGNSRPLQVDERALKLAWESSHRSTKEDWSEWMRHFSVELLKESPSCALRICAGLAQLQVCNFTSL